MVRIGDGRENRQHSIGISAFRKKALQRWELQSMFGGVGDVLRLEAIDGDH